MTNAGAEAKPKDASPHKRALPDRRAFLGIWLHNPVLRRELLTGLRDNKAFIFHFIYLAALTTVILLAWPETDVSMRSAKARELFDIFGLGQLILLAVMTPAFSAGALTLEKERCSLDLLLTAPIRQQTILAGKYAGAVVYLLFLIISTAPLAAVCLWLGGIGADAVVGQYVFLSAAAGAFGMVGLTCSTFFERTQISLSIAYLAIFPVTLLMLLFARAAHAGEFFALSAAVWPTSIFLIATVVMYRICLRRLRRPFDPVIKTADDDDDDQVGLVLQRRRFPDNLFVPIRREFLIPDNANPIFHKEQRSDILGRGTVFLRTILQVGMFLAVAAMALTFLGREDLYVHFIALFSMITAPALAANAFTQERERGTLELLLTTPLRPATVVFGKFFVRFRLSLLLLAIIGAFLIFVPLVGQIPFPYRLAAFVLYVALLIGTLFFEISLAFFYSMVCKTTFQSMIATYGTLLLLFALPSAVHQLLLVFGKHMPLEEIVMTGFTSPFAAANSIYAVFGPQGNRDISPIRSVWFYYLFFVVSLGTALMGFAYFYYRRWTSYNKESGRL
jgi:ABC-type transport system involved in multi-copper enzyme maturation permease subunit